MHAAAPPYVKFVCPIYRRPRPGCCLIDPKGIALGRIVVCAGRPAAWPGSARVRRRAGRVKWRCHGVQYYGQVVEERARARARGLALVVVRRRLEMTADAAAVRTAS
jgi:hypothetical protein